MEKNTHFQNLKKKRSGTSFTRQRSSVANSYVLVSLSTFRLSHCVPWRKDRRVSRWLFPGCGNSSSIFTPKLDKCDSKNERSPMMWNPRVSFATILSYVKILWTASQAEWIFYPFSCDILCWSVFWKYQSTCTGLQIDVFRHPSPKWRPLPPPTASLEKGWRMWGSRRKASDEGFYKIPVSAWKLSLIVGNRIIRASHVPWKVQVPLYSVKKTDGMYPSECSRVSLAHCKWEWHSVQAPAQPA